jgi:hypothetical protein
MTDDSKLQPDSALWQILYASNEVTDSVKELADKKHQGQVSAEAIDRVEDALTDWAFNSVKLRATLIELRKELKNA